jgi:hypothetical protein
MPSLTEDLQTTVRSSTGTSLTFNGDIHALLDIQNIPQGQFNERMIAYVTTLDATVITAAGALNYALSNPNNFVSVLATASFFAPLTSSLSLSKGTGVATFTRATTATVMGYAPTAVAGDAQVLLTCAAGEARFEGARRVSQGVWSEVLSDGTAIPAATLKGYLAEGAATNLFLNSATLVTQTVTLAAGSNTLSFYGTGTVILSGVATGTLVGTGAANRVSLTVTATAGACVATVTGSCTSGQLELGATATSYIPTTTVAVTRNADTDTYPTAGNLVAAQGTLYGEFVPNSTAQSSIFMIYIDLNNYIDLSYNYVTPQGLILRKNVAGVTVSIQSALNVITVGVKVKWALSYGPSGLSLALNGVVVHNASTTVLASLPVNMQFMMNQISTGQINNTAENLRLWTTQLTATQLVQITTPTTYLLGTTFILGTSSLGA